MTPMNFAGTFRNIHTYAMNAAPVKGGISSDNLQALKKTVLQELEGNPNYKEGFPGLQIETDVYVSPASIRVSHRTNGNESNVVRAAEELIERELKRKGVQGFTLEA